MGQLQFLVIGAVVGGLLAGCSGVNSGLKSSLDTVYTMSVSGGSKTQVVPLSGVTGLGEFNEPSYSPDGTKLVVVGQKYADLYICATNGTSLTRLTQTSSITETSPEWSPSGTWIAYIGTQSNGQKGLYIISPTGTNQTLLMSGITHFGWNPSGTKLFAIGNNLGLYVVDPNGTISDTGRIIKTAYVPFWIGNDTLQFASGQLSFIWTSTQVRDIPTAITMGSTIPPTTYIDKSTTPNLAYFAKTSTLISLGQADMVTLSSNGAYIALTLRGAVYTTSSNTLQRRKIFDTAGSTIQSITWGPDHQTVYISSSSGLHVAKYDGSTSSTLFSIGAGDFDISADGLSVVYTGTREETL